MFFSMPKTVLNALVPVRCLLRYRLPISKTRVRQSWFGTQVSAMSRGTFKKTMSSVS